MIKHNKENNNNDNNDNEKIKKKKISPLEDTTLLSSVAVFVCVNSALPFQIITFSFVLR